MDCLINKGMNEQKVEWIAEWMNRWNDEVMNKSCITFQGSEPKYPLPRELEHQTDSPFLPLILVLEKFFKLLRVPCVKTAISLAVKRAEPGPLSNLQPAQTRAERLQPSIRGQSCLLLFYVKGQ